MSAGTRQAHSLAPEHRKIRMDRIYSIIRTFLRGLRGSPSLFQISFLSPGQVTGMKVYSSGNKLTLRDSPGCFYLVGFFFFVLGVLTAIIAIGSASDPAVGPIGSRILAFALGMSAIAAGLYVIYDSPGSRIIADKDALTVVILRRGLLRKERNNYLFSEIQDIHTVEKQDIDGDPVFSLRMSLIDGKEVALTNLWIHNKILLEENASRLKLHILK
jgi:hypothetical protein